MVTVEEIPAVAQEEEQPNEPAAASEERLLDAEEIERVAAQVVERPTARMQLESLAKRLRKEGEALKRVERSSSRGQQTMTEEKKEDGSSGATTPAAAAAPPTETTATTEQEDPPAAPVAEETTKKASAPPPPPPVVPTSVKYVPIDRFAFDAGGYNAPFVTLYIDLPAVGTIPRENIECHFATDSFDLVVKELRGKSYRLCKDSLEKDIDVEKSKIVVKADKILVKLAKVKQSDYGGYDYWSKLTDDKKKKQREKDDPGASIMNMMKEMYDSGDDNMKKMIGETMLKQRRGELGKDRLDDDFGSGI